ncbi:unnamed protein product [Arabis nemorensis]|uniref:BHLH domain-containing protein n=1 Tax=Arabis nemorensis TaxID=586526 RepID=A0A565BDK0_9BRAS|nr:unnamed protein product [Arabis nemorensis]
MPSYLQHLSLYTQPRSYVSMAPPPPPSAPYDPPEERLTNQFMNMLNLGGNIVTGAEPRIPVARESTQVCSSSSNGYSLIPVTKSTETRPVDVVTETRPTCRVSHTFVVPSLGWKEKTVVTKTKAETEPIQIQQAAETEMETADDRKRKEREETEKTEEAPSSTTTSRKRSRTAEMHNLCERRRREKINQRMKALQELIPRSKKCDKASMLDDAIELMKSLQMQVQMISTGSRMMRPPNMQPHMAMGMNRPPFIPFPGTLPPFPSQGHMAGLGPSYPPPHYPFPAYDPSRPNPVWNHHPQLPGGYMNPYSQFAGLQQQQMQQPPPPLQNETTSQLSLGEASGSREHEDEENQPSGE